MNKQNQFSYGDKIVLVRRGGIGPGKTVNGAPPGTKAVFLGAVGEHAACIKITKRLPPPKEHNSEPHYRKGAKLTVDFSYIIKDNGSFEAAERLRSREIPFKPIYEA